MSLGGWEVVTKNKKEKNSGKHNYKLTKTEKKKFIDNAPKVEDFLPLSQVKTLYDNLHGKKENNTSVDKENEMKEIDVDKKKQQKLNNQNVKKKIQSKELSKEKSNNITDKVGITIDEVNELLETNRTRFPEAPLIWLKDLVAYVNANIPAEKEDFTIGSKSGTYPLNLLTKTVRQTFEKVIKSVGSQNLQLFYEGTLLLMIKNMTFGLPNMGCIIFLKLIAQIYPEITCMNTEKLISLRNSYQNKKNIGMAILWTLSQSGMKNLNIGLTLWHEVMAPMLESRNYAFYVIKILKEFFNYHKNVNFTAGMYLIIVDDFCSGKINIPGSLRVEVNNCLEVLRTAAMKSENVDVNSLFETIFDIISPKFNPVQREEFLKILSACIAADNKCLLTWTKLYSKRLYQSELLIKQLTDDWDTISKKVDGKMLKETLAVFQGLEMKTKKSREEMQMIICQQKAQVLMKKMSATSEKNTLFSWKKGSIILLLIIGVFVALDCRKHDSFEASITGKFVKTSGFVGYGEKAWSTTKLYSNKGLGYLEVNYPDYYKSASKLGKQYTKLAEDVYLVGRNTARRLYNNTLVFINGKMPIITQSIEYYAPGWLDTMQSVTYKQIEKTKKYSAQATDFVVQQSSSLIRWLETNVFIGSISPENILGYLTKVMKSTKTYASQTYDWVYEKVQTISKIQ